MPLAKSTLNSNQERAIERTNSNKVWMAIIFVMILVRMWLTAGDEFTFQINDTRSYSNIAASYPAVGSPFPNHLPGMPLLSNFVTAFGIPFKLYLDALLVFTVYLVIKAFSPFLNSAFGCSLVFKSLIAGTILFNPWFLCQSRIFMTEALTSILLFGLPVSTANLLNDPVCKWKARHIFWPTIVTAFISLVRPEFALLGIYWLALFSILFWFHFGTRSKFRNQFEQGSIRVFARLLLLTLPIVTSWLSLEALKSFHESRYGVRGAFANEAEGVKSLLNALYQIKPEQEIRFAPVPMESLRRACNECPTLKNRQQLLLDTNGPSFGPAFSQLKLKDEVGTWLNWHLIWAFGGLNKKSNQEMLQCVQEIHQAFAESRLEKRNAVFPIDPLFEKWSPDVVPLFKKSMISSFYPSVYRFRSIPEARHVEPDQRLDIEDSLLPRKGTVSDPPYFFSATYWIPSDGEHSRFEHLDIVDQEGRSIGNGKIEREPERSIVKLKLEAIGYSSKDSLFLEFVGPTGTIRIPFRLQKTMDWKEIAQDRTDSKPQSSAEAWLIECRESGSRFHSRERAQDAIFRNYNRFLIGAIITCFVLGISGCVNRLSSQHFLLLTVFMGVLIFGRCTMYTLMEAWTNWGLERYVGPNHLVAVLFTLTTALVFGAIVRSILDSALCRFQKPKTTT